jgi:DNA-binding winged helix-turn-helix (wHTH) protein
MMYAFGEYELDITCYELRRSGQPQQIEPKVFDLLAYLVQQRDRAVSKDELFEQVWSNPFVSESALLYCIMAARKVLGDNGRGQRLIKTIHGRGYRFVGTVEESLSQKPPEHVEMAAQAAVLVHAAPVALEPQTGEAERRQLSVLYCRIASLQPTLSLSIPQMSLACSRTRMRCAPRSSGVLMDT